MKLSALPSLLFPLLLQTRSGQSAPARLSVNPDTGAFIDSEGNTYIFHGLNSVSKSGPIVEAISEEQLDVMEAAGFNVVRLGFSWDQVRGDESVSSPRIHKLTHMQWEVKPDEWSDEYLQSALDLIRSLGERGIYSFIDMHQDVVSSQFCGHGFPEFYMWPENSTEYLRDGKYAFPIPLATPEYGEDDEYSVDFGLIDNCGDASSSPLGWAGMYMARALSNSCGMLYGNVDGRLDRFTTFWRKAAEVFKEEDYVLAYELVNEPWVGDTWKDPALIVPTVSDKKVLQPFYDTLAEAIREVDSDTIIFYEPSTGGNIQDTFESGFTSGPGGSDFDEKNALSYHIYCPPLQTDIGTASKSKLVSKACVKASDWQIGVRGKDVERLNTAGFLSEFGAVDPNNEYARDYLRGVGDVVDTFLHSWTYWYMHVDVENGNAELRTLARSYARKTAGVVESMNFDSDSGEFVLTFTTGAVGGESEIFASDFYYYGRGKNVVVEGGEVDGGAVSFVVDGDYVRVTNVVEGVEVVVTVTAK
ncbi:hypothetical protein TL16_g06106 [Triparma laevis f. inornata]|uniref:Endoglycoceramidase n=1 Tax=Triparma laevis f. inornata TaxID=1714386 RepID=A0A9W7ASJ1_9STRA|nr:hypothetical protein TL16_g06106 [Triparma laevis f. inornata]